MDRRRHKILARGRWVNGIDYERAPFPRCAATRGPAAASPVRDPKGWDWYDPRKMRTVAPRSHSRGELLETSITSVKRGVYLVAFPLLGLAFAVFGALAWRSGGFEGVESWGFPLGFGVIALATVAIWLRWTRLQVVEYTLLSFAVGALLALMISTAFGHTHTDAEAPVVLGWLGYWLPVLYGFVFMVFGVRVGAVVSLALYAASLLAGLSHLVVPEGHSDHQLLMLGQTYLSNIVIIVVLIGVGTILRRQVRHTDRLEEEVHTDVLTGLPNRRLLSHRIAEEMARAERYHRPFAIVLFDLDHFKVVNDRHGHPVGDEVLKAIGPMLQGNLRETDTLGRWGGEEFLVLLPEMDVPAAARMAERMRQVVESGRFAQGIRLTASFGVARYWRGEPMADLLERVDRALYAAKDAGRNRVVPSPDA